MSRLQEISTAKFAAEVLHADRPVLVDFYAPWCGPCRAVGPVLEALAAEYASQVKIVKVNVDDEPRLAEYYRISGVPSLLFFKDGQQVDSVIGLPHSNILRSKIARLLPAAAHRIWA